MADGVLGLGSGQAASLNQELIDKLKEAEREARVKPIEDDIEEWDKENEKIAEIIVKANELLETIKGFDLYNISGTSVFDQKSANVTGTSAVFDSVDDSKLSEGTTTVFVEQLAKKDVYQTNTIADATATIATSTSIEINGETFTTQGEDYSSLATLINASASFTASYDSGAGQLTINGEVFSTTGNTYTDVAALINASASFTSQVPTRPASGDIITLSQPGRPVYQSDITVSSTDLVDASGGTITIDGKNFTVTATTTYADLVDSINADTTLSATITIAGRLSITNADKKSTVSITESLGSTTLGLSLGEKFSTEGKSYESLANSINSNSNYVASVESVGTSSSRIVIKGAESGLDNAINITQTGVDLGLNDAANHTVTAQNLKATIDGVDYDVSSNVVVVGGGLKVTAVEENKVGEFSTISIQKNTSSIEPSLQEFVTKYNELNKLIDTELYSADSSIQDNATLRMVVSNIKEKLFGTYGSDENKLSIFTIGFELDQYGTVSLNTNTLKEEINNNLEDLKTLFLGTAENEGLGTQLKSYVDSLDSFDGLLTQYQNNMISRKTSLEKEKKSAIEDLDEKYAQLAQQFAAYGTIINQFESQFSGLKLMIQQSTAS